MSPEMTSEQDALRFQSHLQAVLDSTAISFTLIDASRRILVANELSRRRARIIHGRDLEPGNLIDDFVLPADRQGFDDRFTRTLRGEESVVERTFEVSGALYHFEFRFHPVFEDRAVTAVCMTAEDITRRKQLEERLVISQKMDAIGRLSGGIAHDFNNLLTVINMCSASLLEGLSQDDPHYMDAQEIHAAGQRGAEMTRHLLSFSHNQPVLLQCISVNDVVWKAERILRRLIGKEILLTTDVVAAVPFVLADSQQLEQVIVNLVVNARDAMPAGGEIVLKTRRIEVAEPFWTCGMAVVPGVYTEISVTDTGIGMDADTQARIFEPFFTTKQSRNGTGLGLAMVYGTIRRFRGSLSVTSKPGQGTVITIRLPEALEEQDSAAE